MLAAFKKRFEGKLQICREILDFKNQMKRENVGHLNLFSFFLVCTFPYLTYISKKVFKIYESLDITYTNNWKCIKFFGLILECKDKLFPYSECHISA